MRANGRTLGDTSASVPVQSIQEIKMSIGQLAPNPCEQTGRQCTERLFLSGSQITKNTNVLREDVLTSTDNGDRRVLKLLGTLLRVITLICHNLLFESTKNVRDFGAFFEVVVLVGNNEP
jgi:hypothetical protein